MEKNKIRKRKHESGVILVTVILMILLLAIIAVGIMSISVSQVSSGYSVVDTVLAEQLATGAFYQNHQGKLDGCAACPDAGDCNSCSSFSAPQTLNGKTYSVTVAEQAGNPAVANGSAPVSVTITY